MDTTVEFTTIDDGLEYTCSWMDIRSVKRLERGCRLSVLGEKEHIHVEQEYGEVINRINNAIVRDREHAE